MVNSKITSFEDLNVWQKAAELVEAVYKLTGSFPTTEKFALSDQVQRSAASVPANIAEGFGRLSKNEKLQFYNIAYGSLLETKSHLLIAERLGYVPKDKLAETLQIIVSAQKLINASRKSLS